MVLGIHGELIESQRIILQESVPLYILLPSGTRGRPQVCWLRSGHLYPLSHRASSQSVCYELWTGRVPVEHRQAPLGSSACMESVNRLSCTARAWRNADIPFAKFLDSTAACPLMKAISTFDSGK